MELSWTSKNIWDRMDRFDLLWQLLDQCPIAAQAVNLKSRYLVGTWVVYSQENSTENHNSILPTIYISNLGLCYDCALSYPNVHALSLCPLLIHHMSTLRLAYCIYVLWCHTLNFCHLCMHHVYTMRNPCC